MQIRSTALRALKAQAGKQFSAPAPTKSHVFDIDEIDIGKYGWDRTLLVYRDERKELLDSLLEFYQQHLFKMSAKHPGARYTLIEILKDGSKQIRYEDYGWHELFKLMTDVYRIRGVKPMYTLRLSLHDLQGENIIPREDRRFNMFEYWLKTEFQTYRSRL